jgi:hypothetical protein
MPKEPYNILPPHNSVKLYNDEFVYGAHVTGCDDGIENISFLIGKYRDC